MNRDIRNTRGFTLIELMIVIAIAAILVALAVPAYQTYTSRAKVTECIAAASVPKLQIAEYHQATGVWPPDFQTAGFGQLGNIFTARMSKYCRVFFYNNSEGDFAVWVDSQAIDSDLAGQFIVPVMSPVINPSRGSDWRCTRGFTSVTALKYLPSNCRGPNIF